jgi:hypothetical protein
MMNAHKATVSAAAVILSTGLLVGCLGRSSSWPLERSETAAQLKALVAEKQAQAEAAARAEGNELLPEFGHFFAAAAQGDWQSVSNRFEEFRKRAPHFEGKAPRDSRLTGTQWFAVLETWGAFTAFLGGDDKYPLACGTSIIASIPPGSVYFGGTDPGRFVITALQKSQVRADPFFTLSQNALVDWSYLEYLRGMYGDKIYIPKSEDSQKCFQDYLTDAQRRLLHDQQSPNEPRQLKPGEGVTPVTQDGQMRVQVSGQVAVMSLNALLVKVIFDKNPDREIFIEEGFPLDWMYPHLEPHGLIMKINRQPPSQLPDEAVSRDHDYWAQAVKPLIGDWLTEEATIQQIAEFAQSVWLRRDFNDFKGDPGFIRDDYSHTWVSKMRSAIGGIYAWRLSQATSAAEKERMAREADFAFRQALAMCPYSSEVVFRYGQFLISRGRILDAILVAETAEQMPLLRESSRVQFHNLAEQLKQYQNTH